MLKYLQVGNNPLNAVLPNSIGNLSSTIEDFHIADEHINGLIPTSIGNMTGLTSLSLQGNNLTGSIPSEIGKLKQLQGLALYNNKLQGRIPEVVCHLSNLVQLYLDGNELSGLIPECFGNLSMLQKLYLGPNKFSSKFPLCLWKMSGLLYLDVSQNSIEGELPSDIGGLKAIVELYLYNNHFSEKWLYKEDRHLNLHQRVTVMLDAAMAVEYLHHGHVTPIVHCDLKPANVLLDEDMVAHVEYGSKGIVSASGDVYSYGIMLMEVLTKRRPTDEKLCNENLDLRKWIIQSFSGSMMDIVDANLFCEEVQITCKSEICIASMIELALDCTKETPESRITMKDVVKRLNKINNTFLET
ncbi:receptor kinase-like protein Xa21 [Solanum stenotomum]|uniref:receptor kinase-like protein Xa21 n=1 Tax=Solanum stenotomum TaxID=172797 RepID=UPI0020D0A549|nr:receptor kinase-like protein Xa21 [Solanum stenotomum]